MHALTLRIAGRTAANSTTRQRKKLKHKVTQANKGRIDSDHPKIQILGDRTFVVVDFFSNVIPAYSFFYS